MIPEKNGPIFKIQVDGKELRNLFFQAFGISIVKFPGKLVDFGCRVFVKPIFPVIHAEFPMNKRKKKCSSRWTKNQSNTRI